MPQWGRNMNTTEEVRVRTEIALRDMKWEQDRLRLAKLDPLVSSPLERVADLVLRLCAVLVGYHAWTQLPGGSVGGFWPAVPFFSIVFLLAWDYMTSTLAIVRLNRKVDAIYQLLDRRLDAEGAKTCR